MTFAQSLWIKFSPGALRGYISYVCDADERSIALSEYPNQEITAGRITLDDAVELSVLLESDNDKP